MRYLQSLIAMLIFYGLASHQSYADNDQIRNNHNVLRQDSALYLLYAEKKNKNLNLDKMLEVLDRNYNNMNEFNKKRHKLKYEQELKEYIQQAKQENRFFIDIPIRLPEYKFEKKAFVVPNLSTSRGKSLVINNATKFFYSKAGLGIEVIFEEWDTDAVFKIKSDQAENLVKKIGSNRRIRLIMYGPMASIQAERRKSYLPIVKTEYYKLNMSVKRIEMVTMDGYSLGSVY